MRLDVDVHGLGQIQRQHDLRNPGGELGVLHRHPVVIHNLPVSHLDLNRPVKPIQPFHLHQVGVDRPPVGVLIRLAAIQAEHLLVPDRQLHMVGLCRTQRDSFQVVPQVSRLHCPLERRLAQLRPAHNLQPLVPRPSVVAGNQRHLERLSLGGQLQWLGLHSCGQPRNLEIDRHAEAPQAIDPQLQLDPVPLHDVQNVAAGRERKVGPRG